MRSAVDILKDVSSGHASGELVAADGDVEVHVFLHEGRVAWATSSEAPQAFLRHLVETHGADREGLREVVEECRRTRKRFGRTLVEWGLATDEQVRDSLRHQITGALGTLRRIPRERALFLPKTLSYADDVSFELAELIADEAPDSGRSDASADVLERYLKACGEVSWAAAVPPGHVGGAVTDPDPILQLAASLVEVGGAADTLTVRSLEGAVIGRRMNAEHWLFAGVPSGVGLGLPLAVMAHVVGVRDGRSLRKTPGKTIRAKAGPGLLSSIQPLAKAVETTEELVAAVVVSSDQVAGALETDVNDSALTASARRFSGALQLSLGDCLPVADSLVSDLRYEQLSMHARQGGFDYFGVMLGAESAASLWLTLWGSNSAGMGWALLPALARQVSELLVTP